MDDEDLDLVELDELGEEDDEDDDDIEGEDELVGDELDDLLDMISGMDEIVGEEDDDEDDDDEIGARRRRRRRRRRGRLRARRRLARRARALARIKKRRRALSRGKKALPRAAIRGRVLLLGGTATQGGTAGQLLIPTTVQELCRIDRLFVTGRDEDGVLDPASYSIGDIKVGTKSQFAALPPLPGIMFQADATGQGVRLGLDTVQTGTDFTVVISNAPASSTFTWGAYASALR